MTEELAVITHSYDLLLWTLRHVEKFPRLHRYGVGNRIETKFFELLDLLLEAKYAHEKAELLRQAALRTEQIRMLFRVSKDLQILALNSHGHGCERLAEIGRQIGAWRKHLDDRA